VISALESIDCGGDGTDRVRQSEALFVDRIVKTDPWHPGGQVFRGNLISTWPVSEMDHARLPAHMATPSGSEMHPHDTVAQKRWNQAPQDPSET
jgi:hypothetical protein